MKRRVSFRQQVAVYIGLCTEVRDSGRKDLRCTRLLALTPRSAYWVGLTWALLWLTGRLLGWTVRASGVLWVWGLVRETARGAGLGRVIGSALAAAVVEDLLALLTPRPSPLITV